jgi:hypothetical protein
MGLRHVDRLRSRLTDLLGGESEVVAAFQVQTGSSPGTEVLLFPLGFLAIFGATKLRRYFTVAVTADQVLLIRNRWETKPAVIEKRLDLAGALGPVRGSGDYRIEVGGDQFWVPLRWLDEARRAERLSIRPAGSGG